VGEPHPDGTRTVFFELNGQPREVTVRDRSLEVKAAAAPKADPNQPGEIGAPIPGVVSTVAVEMNQTIEKGDQLLVMEAMKMQSTVYAPVGGEGDAGAGAAGQHVEAKDLLLEIEWAPRPPWRTHSCVPPGNAGGLLPPVLCISRALGKNTGGKDRRRYRAVSYDTWAWPARIVIGAWRMCDRQRNSSSTIILCSRSGPERRA
jgi:biotin carboxyl carrier protein